VESKQTSAYIVPNPVPEPATPAGHLISGFSAYVEAGRPATLVRESPRVPDARALSGHQQSDSLQWLSEGAALQGTRRALSTDICKAAMTLDCSRSRPKRWTALNDHASSACAILMDIRTPTGIVDGNWVAWRLETSGATQPCRRVPAAG
jgi:hypothetical protein